MKKNTMYWLIGALALVGVGGFLWMNQNASQGAEDASPSSGTGSSPVLPSSGGSSTGYNPPPFSVNAGAYYGLGGNGNTGVVGPIDPMTYNPLDLGPGVGSLTVVGTGGIAAPESAGGGFGVSAGSYYGFDVLKK